MKIFALVLTFLGSFWGAHSQGSAPNPAAQDLMVASDKARGALASSKGIRWTAQVTSVEEGKKSETQYLIKCRGDNAWAQVQEPARQKGEIMLFNDRNIWFFRPGLKKPVSISPRQKLMGQAANGDIASTNYARDYEATIIGEEQISGEANWKLDLKAKAKNVTYDRIRYWVSKERKLGVRAEFLTLQGEVFKSAEFTYKNVLVVADKKVPFVSEMVIKDNQANVTTITYNGPREEEQPEGLFNVNNLVR